MPDFTIRSLALAALFFAIAAGRGLEVWAVFRLRRFFRQREVSAAPELPPLSLWRAIKAGVPGLAEKLDALIQASRPGDQILLGVDLGAAEPAHALCQRFPDRTITVVECPAGYAENPKISKFIQMAPAAQHSRWLLTDSEALPDREFLENVRAEWQAEDCAAVTCGYRFTGASDWAAVLDTAPVLLTLWPGLATLGEKPLAFTLGAAVAIHRENVEALGGWAAFSDELAEDHRLGARLAASGKTVRLSRQVLSLDGDHPSWADYLRHQHRMAVTYWVANPAGAAGLPVLHGLGLALAFAELRGWDALGAATVGGTWLVKAMTARANATTLGWSKRRLAAAALIAPLVETVFWLAALISPAVWWSGRWRRVDWRGRLRRL